jgi:hypothetical protein
MPRGSANACRGRARRHRPSPRPLILTQALALFRDLGNPYGQAGALDQLGVVQRLTGGHTAAAASHRHALALYRDVGDRVGQAEALNILGELLSSSSASQRSRDYHTQALAIARDVSAPWRKLAP